MSVCTAGRVRHFDIKRRSRNGHQEFRLKRKEWRSSIPRMLEFYENDSLSKDIGRIGSCLLLKRIEADSEEINNSGEEVSHHNARSLYYYSFTIGQHGIIKHPSYHGHLNQEEAESKLKRLHPHSCKRFYITRYSSEHDQYKVSVATIDECGKYEFKHFPLEIGEDNMYSIEGAQSAFNSISSMLRSYKGIYLEGIGLCVPHKNHPCKKHLLLP